MDILKSYITVRGVNTDLKVPVGSELRLYINRVPTEYRLDYPPGDAQ